MTFRLPYKSIAQIVMSNVSIVFHHLLLTLRYLFTNTLKGHKLFMDVTTHGDYLKLLLFIACNSYNHGYCA